MFTDNKKAFVWVAVLMLQPAVACVNPELGQRDYVAVGVVHNQDNQVVYEEHHYHKADMRGGVSKVEYKSPQGELIAKKTIDYDCRSSAPNYTLTMALGEQGIEQVKWQSNQLIITQAQDERILKDLDSTNLVIDAGFDNFVFENWSALMRGEEKVIDFLHVPGKRLFTLVIKLQRDNSDVQVSDDVALFKITTKSKLFRLFSDPIFLAYDKVSKNLAYYYGPTNLRGNIPGLENSRQVAIKYRYN